MGRGCVVVLTTLAALACLAQTAPAPSHTTGDPSRNPTVETSPRMHFRLLLVEASVRRFRRGVRSAPVGEDKALKVKILSQDFREQVAVFAGIVAVDAVVGTHEGAGV